MARRLPQFAVLVAAVAVTAALLPRALSSAAGTSAAAAAASPSPSAPAPAPAARPASNISWNPDGTPAQIQSSPGDCTIAMSGEVTEDSAGDLSAVSTDLNDVPPATVNQGGIKNITLSAPQAPAGTSMTLYADAHVDCSLVNQADAYVKKDGYASLGQFAQAVAGTRLSHAPAGSARAARQQAVLAAYDAQPDWLRYAIAAVAGSVAFAVVTYLAAAAIVAQGLAADTTAAALAGCLGGQIGAAVAAVIGDGANTMLERLAAVVKGCIAGAAAGIALVMGAVKTVLSALIGVVLVGSFPVVFGGAVTSDASAAGVDLSPYNTAVQDLRDAVKN